jgi:hypothetical protein
MIIDALNRMSSAQTVTTGSENGVVSAASIDLGLAGRDIGAGENVYVVVVVTTAMAGTNPNATTVALVTDDAATLATPTVVQTLGVLATNSPVGTLLIARIQPSAAFERYIGIRYTAANALSGAAFTAFLADEVDVQRYYANGFDIATS